MKKVAWVLGFLFIGWTTAIAQIAECKREFSGTTFEKSNIQWDTVTYAYIAFDEAERVIPVSSQLKNVKTLNFIACDAGEILGKMAYLPTVTFISMNRIELDQWPKSLNQYNTISCLDLAGNNLLILPDNLSQFTNLQQLSMGDGAYGGNKLTVIDETICSLTKLKSLCFFQNPIDSISPNIVNLKNLEYLNLNQTNITYIPATIGELKNLQDLQLSSTEISTIPIEILKCTELTEIGLNNCEKLDFSQALDVLIQLPNFTNLNISLNKVSGLADKISQLKNLETLDINNTDLTFDEVKQICDNCKKLKKVETIIEGLTAEKKKALEKKYKHIDFRFKWF
jgi:Leucine-rich repeat (LRR) protein